MLTASYVCRPYLIQPAASSSESADRGRSIIQVSLLHIFGQEVQLWKSSDHIYTPFIIVFLFNKIILKVVLQFSISLVNDFFFDSVTCFVGYACCLLTS